MCFIQERKHLPMMLCHQMIGALNLLLLNRSLLHPHYIPITRRLWPCYKNPFHNLANQSYLHSPCNPSTNRMFYVPTRKVAVPRTISSSGRFWASSAKGQTPVKNQNSFNKKCWWYKQTSLAYRSSLELASKKCSGPESDNEKNSQRTRRTVTKGW